MHTDYKLNQNFFRRISQFIALLQDFAFLYQIRSIFIGSNKNILTRMTTLVKTKHKKSDGRTDELFINKKAEKRIV